jgi:hypothetical protein
MLHNCLAGDDAQKVQYHEDKNSRLSQRIKPGQHVFVASSLA